MLVLMENWNKITLHAVEEDMQTIFLSEEYANDLKKNKTISGF